MLFKTFGGVIMSSYYKIGDFAQEIGVSTQTLRRWDSDGTLKPVKVTDGDTRYYSEYQLKKYRGELFYGRSVKRLIIGYARVSSHSQKDDLERQVENIKTYICMQKGISLK